LSARPKALVSWSTGKDAAYALHIARQLGELEVVGILTTVTSTFGRVSMHGTREALLDLQAAALGLPCWKVYIPAPCPNEVYAREMRIALDRAKRQHITHMVFGDLALQDVRSYREAHLAEVGTLPVFPLWQRDTAALAAEMIAVGLRATITCVDPRKLDRSFVGRSFDDAFLAALPRAVDACGENGEFHSFVYDGPMFREPVAHTLGEKVLRDNRFWYCDLVSPDMPQRPE
jgi:uncharacterized protein (TIGR00290 family)